MVNISALTLFDIASHSVLALGLATGRLLCPFLLATAAPSACSASEAFGAAAFCAAAFGVAAFDATFFGESCDVADFSASSCCGPVAQKLSHQENSNTVVTEDCKRTHHAILGYDDHLGFVRFLRFRQCCFCFFRSSNLR